MTILLIFFDHGYNTNSKYRNASHGFSYGSFHFTEDILFETSLYLHVQSFQVVEKPKVLALPEALLYYKENDNYNRVFYHNCIETAAFRTAPVIKDVTLSLQPVTAFIINTMNF